MRPGAIISEVEAAESRIRPHIRHTPLQRSDSLSGFGHADVHCKLENLQLTGSFKVRGAFNKMLTLSDEQKKAGVVVASSGNHGAAVAHAARNLRIPCLVLVPTTASRTKVAAIGRLGASIEPVEGDPIEAELAARRLGIETGREYISPYNDPRIIGGQGTIGIELHRELPALDAVFVSVGGGGLISGIAAYLKSRRPDLRVIGCSPTNSPVMVESVKAGRIVDMPSLPTLSDGTAGGIERDSITLDLVSTLVDEFVTVAEEQIVDELRRFIENERVIIEGAAAVALAAYRATADRYRGSTLSIIICGGNVDTPVLQRVLGIASSS